MPAIAADMQLVAAVDADDAEVLDRRLGAVARTARHGDLELVRHPAAPAHPLDLDPEPGRSCVPKRHHSDPTQVFTVRSALP